MGFKIIDFQGHKACICQDKVPLKEVKTYISEFRFMGVPLSDCSEKGVFVSLKAYVKKCVRHVMLCCSYVWYLTDKFTYINLIRPQCTWLLEVVKLACSECCGAQETRDPFPTPRQHHRGVRPTDVTAM